MQCLIPFLNSEDFNEYGVVFFPFVKKNNVSINTGEINQLDVSTNEISLDTDVPVTFKADIPIISRGLEFVKVASMDVKTFNNILHMNTDVIKINSNLISDCIIDKHDTIINSETKDIQQSLSFNGEVYQIEETQRNITCSTDEKAVILSEIISKGEKAFNINAEITENNIEIYGDIKNRISKIVNPDNKMFISLKKGWNYISVPYFINNGKIAKVSEAIKWIADQLKKDPQDVIVFASTIKDDEQLEYVVGQKVDNGNQDFYMIENINGELVPVGLKIYSNVEALISAKSIIDLGE